MKIGSMVYNIKFNDETNMLCALGDGRLQIYCYPSCAYVDKELLPKAIIEKETRYSKILLILKRFPTEII